MTTNPSTNALGDTPPTVCPRCAGPDMSTDLLWVVT